MLGFGGHFLTKARRCFVTSAPTVKHEIEPLWGIEDLSRYHGVPVTTLYEWRTKHYGAAGQRIGRYIRYRPADVLAWVLSADLSAA
jgi:hypothetical protein